MMRSLPSSAAPHDRLRRRVAAELFTPGSSSATRLQGTWFAVGELDGSYTPACAKSVPYGQRWPCDITTTSTARSGQAHRNTMTMGPFGSWPENFERSHCPACPKFRWARRESLAVGAALGYRIEPVFGLRADEFGRLQRRKSDHRHETLMSHVGGGRTARYTITSKAAGARWSSFPPGGEAGRNGHPTPFNDAVTEIDRQINSER